jgi:AmmeMemoRadiSam system protein B
MGNQRVTKEDHFHYEQNSLQQGYVKGPDVAGIFYPDNPITLENNVSMFLDEGVALKDISNITMPIAVLAPHAGYIYSGPVAGSAYKNLSMILENNPELKAGIKNVVVLSPAHRKSFRGIATHSAAHFETPLGKIEVSKELLEDIDPLPQVIQYDSAFYQEHAVEVQLPFIQTVLPEAKILPLVVGQTNLDEMIDLFTFLWNPGVNVFVISSDLSHYHGYDEATGLDRSTAKKIEGLNFHHLSSHDACGFYPLRGFLSFASSNNVTAHLVDLRNSGDTQGDHSRVVGYGAFIFERS